MIKQRLLITRFLTWLLTYIYIDLNATANTPTVSSLFSLSTNNSTQLIVLMLTTWNSGTCYEDQHIIQRQQDIPTRSFSCKYLHLHHPWASTGTQYGHPPHIWFLPYALFFPIMIFYNHCHSQAFFSHISWERYFFAGTFFREFRVLWPFSRNQIPAKYFSMVNLRKLIPAKFFTIETREN